MPLARLICAAAVLLALAGCAADSRDPTGPPTPELLSPAVADLRSWTDTANRSGFAAALAESLGGSAAVLGGTSHRSGRAVGRHGYAFEDSSIVLVQLTSAPWDSVMVLATGMAERHLDRLAPGGEPLSLRSREALPFGGGRWRWLSGDRVAELRLRGEPRPGWPANQLWAVSLAVTDRPAAAYDRGVRAREVREVSRVVRWFETLLDRTGAEPSALVRWSMAAGARGTGMDGRSAGTSGGRFAEDRTSEQSFELMLELDGVEPDSIARAIAPRLEAELADALGAHGTMVRESAGLWRYQGRGRAGQLRLAVQRDSGGRTWLEVALTDAPDRRR